MSDGRCPKCRSGMVLGFVPDTALGGPVSDGGTKDRPGSHSGPAQKSKAAQESQSEYFAALAAAIWSSLPTPSSRRNEVAEQGRALAGSSCRVDVSELPASDSHVLRTPCLG